MRPPKTLQNPLNTLLEVERGEVKSGHAALVDQSFDQLDR